MTASQGPVGANAAEARLREQRRKLAQLMRGSAISGGEISSALSALTELAAELLSTERASVWQLSADGTTLDCVDLYQRSSHRHERGARLPAASYPRYFAALFE